MNSPPPLARKRALHLLALAVNSACMTVSLPSQEALDRGEGIVVITVTGNTGRVDQMSSLQLQQVGAEAGTSEFRSGLRHVASGLARDTALFLGTLSPGDYQVVRLGSGGTFIELSPEGRELLGTFRVEPGKVHDLGRLVLTGRNERVLLGRSALLTSNAELVQRFAPEHAKFLAGPVERGWVQPRSPDDKVEELALANPVGADGLVALGDGEVAAASRLGTVLLRSRDGRWRAVRTGGLESLLGVSPAGEGPDRLVAVGEFNTLYALERSGKMRRLQPGNLPPGNLFFVDGNARDGWIVAHRTRRTVTLLASDRLDGGDWKPLRTVKSTVSEAKLWIWRSEDGFGYAEESGLVSWYQRAARVFVDRRAPYERTISDAVGCGARGACIRAGDFLPSLHVTTDGGARWREASPPEKVQAPRLLPDGRVLIPFAYARKLLVSSNGEDWETVSEKHLPGDRLVVVPGVGLFAVNDGRLNSGVASIRFSPDEGKSWTVELTNYVR